MLTTFYTDEGQKYSVFGVNGNPCLGAPCGQCKEPGKTPSCGVIKAFSIMGVIFTLVALFIQADIPKYLDDTLFYDWNIPLFSDVFTSNVGFLVAGLVCVVIYFLTAILAGTKNGGFKKDDESLVEMSNSGSNAAVLTDGFHMAWGSMLCLIFAVVLAILKCAFFPESCHEVYFEDLFKKGYY